MRPADGAIFLHCDIFIPPSRISRCMLAQFDRGVLTIVLIFVDE